MRGIVATGVMLSIFGLVINLVRFVILSQEPFVNLPYANNTFQGIQVNLIVFAIIGLVSGGISCYQELKSARK